MLERDVVDQLHDDDGLADAGAAEEANFAALQVRLEEIDDFDARLEHLQVGRLIFERRRRTMNRPAQFRLHRAIRKVHRLAEHVQHAAERFGTNGHRDRLTEVFGAHAALDAVGRLHRDGAHAVFAEVLLDLADDVDVAGFLRLGLDAQRVVDGRQVPGLELDVHDGPDHLNDSSDSFFFFSHLFTSTRKCFSVQAP